jgi:hypothetical protein
LKLLLFDSDILINLSGVYVKVCKTTKSKMQNRITTDLREEEELEKMKNYSEAIKDSDEAIKLNRARYGVLTREPTKLFTLTRALIKGK